MLSGRQIDDVDRQMREHIELHHSELQSLLCIASGIGPVASACLIAELPELGQPESKTDCISSGCGAVFT